MRVRKGAHMFGSSLYFITLLACTEVHLATDIQSADTIQPTSITTTDLSDEHTPDQPQSVCPTIVITNSIESAMLGYKHWTGTYTPDIFTISINDTEIAPGETYTSNNSEDVLRVTCHYSFMNGMRSGDKTVLYKLHQGCSTATLTFSWLEPHKIIIDNASIIPETT